MAKVIQGVFPHTTKQEQPKKDKPVPRYTIHISIAFSDPLIWRRIQVPGDLNLYQLHLVIQEAMGWSDSHVHQFHVGKISYEPAERTTRPRQSKRFDEANYKLYTLEEGMQFLFTYLYDAGEGWEHHLSLEEVLPSGPELSHPVLLSGEMACPPETVGDIHIYNELTLAQENKDHKDHATLSELAGVPHFDPLHFDLEEAKARVARLAKGHRGQ
jgi:hypothetical protein